MTSTMSGGPTGGPIGLVVESPSVSSKQASSSVTPTSTTNSNLDLAMDTTSHLTGFSAGGGSNGSVATVPRNSLSSMSGSGSSGASSRSSSLKSIGGLGNGNHHHNHQQCHHSNHHNGNINSNNSNNNNEPTSSSSSHQLNNKVSQSPIGSGSVGVVGGNQSTSQHHQPASNSKSSGEMMSASVICLLCQNKLREPKLLDCLHVFCKPCLAGIAQVFASKASPLPTTTGAALMDVNSSSDCSTSLLITCPKCKQDTLTKSIDCLENDCIMGNILDMIAMDERALECSSCKSEQKAVARCSDCAEFLCPNCVTAHQFMRVFEQHTVLEFSQIQSLYASNLARQQQQQNLVVGKSQISPDGGGLNGVFSSSSSTSSSGPSSASSSSSKLNEEPSNMMPNSSRLSRFGQQMSSGHHHHHNHQQQQQQECLVPIHRPLMCKLHPKESFKFFCNSCQMPVCAECVITEHTQPLHAYERLVDVDAARHIDELEGYMRKARESMLSCDHSGGLDKHLCFLNDQAHNAREAIEETYETYKAMLEKRRAALLHELDERVNEKQRKLVETFTGVESSLAKLADVIKFGDRVMQNGNATEILLMKRVIMNQIRYLVNSLPTSTNNMDAAIDLNIRFVNDERRFEKSIVESFGRFYSQKEIKQSYWNSLTMNNNNSSSSMAITPGGGGGDSPVIQQSQQLQNHQLQQQQSLLPPHMLASMSRHQQLMNLQQLQQIQQQNLINTNGLNSHRSEHFDSEWLMMNMLQLQQQQQQQQQQAPLSNGSNNGSSGLKNIDENLIKALYQQFSVSPTSPSSGILSGGNPPNGLGNTDSEWFMGMMKSASSPTSCKQLPAIGHQWSSNSGVGKQMGQTTNHMMTNMNCGSSSGSQAGSSQHSRTHTPAPMMLMPSTTAPIGGGRSSLNNNNGMGGMVDDMMLMQFSHQHQQHHGPGSVPTAPTTTTTTTTSAAMTAAQNFTQLSKLIVGAPPSSSSLSSGANCVGMSLQQQHASHMMVPSSSVATQSSVVPSMTNTAVALSNLNDLASLSALNDFNSLSNVGLSLNAYVSAAATDATSNSASQSPPLVVPNNNNNNNNGGQIGTIGSGLLGSSSGSCSSSSSSSTSSSNGGTVMPPTPGAATTAAGGAAPGASSGGAGNSGGFSGNGNLNPPVRQTSKMSNMQIRTKFGVLGPGKAQFNSPHGFCLGVDEEIIVADTNNHRIQVFDKNGDFKYMFGSPGREEGQLWYPRKVTVMRDSGKFVVCDRGNERSRMQIFNKSGHFIKKISIRYIDIVAGLGITQNGEIVAVDSVSPTVFRISENGDLLKWFDCSEYMREPSDIAISGNEYYVCDFKGHCVVVFNEDGNFMRRIGGENITNFPNGIDVSDAGDVLVGDSHGNRFHVAVFARDGTMISEFECPYVKVSRCCGLKITSEGYVVTLAKNNHHVLVLNTLYVG